MADNGEQGKFANKPHRNSIFDSTISAAVYPGVAAGQFRAGSRPLRTANKLKVHMRTRVVTTYTGQS